MQALWNIINPANYTRLLVIRKVDDTGKCCKQCGSLLKPLIFAGN